MTTLKDLQAARDAVISAESEWMGQKQLCIYVGMSDIKTIRTLLDEAIAAQAAEGSAFSKMETVEQPSNSRGLDLEGLKREVTEAYIKRSNGNCDQCSYEAVSWAIDHLANQGRILPEGWVGVQGWQQIETRPIEGEPYLVTNGKNRWICQPNNFVELEALSKWIGGDGKEHEPATHWARLLPLPTAAQKEGE